MNKEEKELQHLRHMETTIIPILAALGIVGLNFHIQYGRIGQIEKTITLYLLVAPIVLAIAHLKVLISGKIEQRLFVFFIDAIFLVTIVAASIIVVINYGLLRLGSFSFELYLTTLIEAIVTALILLFILIKKVRPAFETNIFPTLCKKYKLFKYKKSK